eukprot:9555023-Ditylum_brightwellii.AAC.1
MQVISHIDDDPQEKNTITAEARRETAKYMIHLKNEVKGKKGLDQRKLWNSGKLTPHKQHDNTEKHSNESSRGLGYREIYASLDDFFKQKNKEAAPFETRLIREEAGLLTRDDNSDNVVLPPITVSMAVMGNGATKEDDW